GALRDLRTFGHQRLSFPLRRLRPRELLLQVPDLRFQFLEPARLLRGRVVRRDPARRQLSVRRLQPLAGALHVAVSAGGEAQELVARPGGPELALEDARRGDVGVDVGEADDALQATAVLPRVLVVRCGVRFAFPLLTRQVQALDADAHVVEVAVELPTRAVGVRDDQRSATRLAPPRATVLEPQLVLLLPPVEAEQRTHQRFEERTLTRTVGAEDDGRRAGGMELEHAAGVTAVIELNAEEAHAGHQRTSSALRAIRSARSAIARSASSFASAIRFRPSRTTCPPTLSSSASASSRADAQ